MKEFLIKKAGAYVRYIDFEGEGLPFIFIHGNGSAGSYSAPETMRMEGLENHRCIIVDLLGCGFSDRPSNQEYTVKFHASYLKELLDYLDFDSFAIVAHSLGGAIGIELASLCDDRLKAIVVAEGNLCPSAIQSGTYVLGSCTDSEFPKVYSEYAATRNPSWQLTSSLWLPEALHKIDADAVIGGNTDWMKMFLDLKCRKYFIVSERAGKRSVANAEILKEKGIPVLFLEKSGHSMTEDNPHGFAKLIKSCL